ncbi:ATP-binding protein [Streptomyces sp. NPDC057877]|uniref:sensor histidine kinase n=1 Tax=Streptomyces sp. NPDC057877 TaxID=3346269 RepID=UPI0036CC0DB4
MTKERVTGPRSGRSHWTTRRWLRAGVAVTLAVLTVLGSLGVWAITRTSQVTDELVDYRSPALEQAVRLESALVDQETGVRGYGLTGERSFLAPYPKGVADERAAARRLRELVRGDARGREDLTTVQRLAGRWRERLARPVSEAGADRAVAVASDRADEGKRLFDAVRRAAQRQQEHLSEGQSEARAELRRSTGLRNVSLAVIGGVIVLVAGLVFEGLRRGVTTPLAHLGRAAREVAGGRFDRPIDGTGPADLRQLAADVEAMRGRLVEELEYSERARQLLDERAGELRRSNTELEQFAYVASHDLQEPLRKVSSFTQLLQRRYGGQLDERADQYIGFAVDGANRMQVLINDLLAFSRVGRVHHDHTTVDLEEVMQRVLDALSVSIEESGAGIEHDPLPTVLGDATQLGILWQNLLSNSVKFRTPGQPPRIRVSVARAGDDWRFAVTDDGIGIAPEFREKVFVLFQRLHTRDAYPGTGIGLAMCKKVVEFHGGTIAVDPGHTPGTRIVFTLPAVDAREGERS